ncbi:MAG: M56 family metallopeptidase [Sphingomonas sp.]
MIAAGVFAWGAEALIASTLLMVLVMVLRGPVRRGFGPGAAYALWLLPAVRLLLPPVPVAWQERVAAPIARANAQFTVLVIEPLGLGREVPVAATPSTGALLGAFWAIGALAFIAWHIAAHTRFCRRLLESAHEVASGPVRVIETPAATGPLAFGIWRKYVAFPSDFGARYDAEERALALTHELTHHARGDLLANWVALLVLAIHWFNPVAWRAFRAFRADQEMACDALVLASRGQGCAHAYGRAIVKSAQGRAVVAACHLHTVSDLKGRLHMLSKAKLSKMRRLAGAGAIGAAMIVGLGVTASGGQAAETLRGGVGAAIGVELPRAALLAPTPPAAPVPAIAAVTPLLVSGQAATPPAPPAPPEMPAPPKVARKVIIVQKSGDGAPIVISDDGDAAADVIGGKDGMDTIVSTRIIKRDKNGKTLTDDTKRGSLLFFNDKQLIERPIRINMPEIDSKDCPDVAGKRGERIIHEQKDGKRRIILCMNRIHKLAIEQAQLAGNSADIERRAYQSALDGVRAARDRMAANSDLAADARKEALTALDQAIAELEENVAKAQ